MLLLKVGLFVLVEEDTVEQTYRFAHLTFEEYLAAGAYISKMAKKFAESSDPVAVTSQLEELLIDVKHNAGIIGFIAGGCAREVFEIVWSHLRKSRDLRGGRDARAGVLVDAAQAEVIEGIMERVVHDRSDFDPGTWRWEHWSPPDPVPLQEYLAGHVLREAEQVFEAGVNPIVTDAMKARHGTERPLQAQRAAARPLAGVRPLVHGDFAALGEPLRACRAAVRPLAGVRPARAR